MSLSISVGTSFMIFPCLVSPYFSMFKQYINTDDVCRRNEILSRSYLGNNWNKNDLKLTLIKTYASLQIYSKSLVTHTMINDWNFQAAPINSLLSKTYCSWCLSVSDKINLSHRLSQTFWKVCKRIKVKSHLWKSFWLVCSSQPVLKWSFCPILRSHSPEMAIILPSCEIQRLLCPYGVLMHFPCKKNQEQNNVRSRKEIKIS